MPFGTADNDLMVGSEDADLLYGLAGDDTLVGLGGNDALVGGPGADRLQGGSGDDVLWADAADARLDGGPGFDYLILTAAVGVQWTLGSMNVEVVVGNAGDDTLDAALSAASIVIYASDGNDRVSLGPGGGYAFGGAGDDTLVGGSGNDILLGNTGADNLEGGAGNDILYIDASDGSAYQGGDGIDSLLVESADAVFLTLAGRGIEVVVANAGDDRVDATGTTASMALYGGAGDDVIRAGSGSTLLEGMDGNDTLIGGSGNDVLIGGSGENFLFGGGGDDQFFIMGRPAGTYTNASILHGGDYDAYDWSSGVSVLIPAGGAGIDTVSVVGPYDAFVVLGDNGIDIGIGNAGDDTLEIRTFPGNASAALSYLVIGNDGNDRLSGGGTGSILYGGAGDDTIFGASSGWFGTGNVLYGDAGNDTIWNGASHFAHGGDGDDVIYTAPQSSAWGDDGADTLDLTAGSGPTFGGAGADLFRVRSDLIPFDSHAAVNGSARIDDWQPGIDKLTFVGMPDAVAGGIPAGLAITAAGADALLTYDATWTNLRFVIDERFGMRFEPYLVTSHFTLTIVGAAGRIDASDFI